ncbi:hypothetical protein [Rhodoblastus sp.]|uniref:hypothetical protein n=1 Tax=Rhodoblastus sp. TaxID=1962975 RepID=UPI003F94B085
MILDPIKASDFAQARPRGRNPAACQLRPLLRLSLLVAIAIGLVSVTVNPSRLMTAGAETARNANPV